MERWDEELNCSPGRILTNCSDEAEQLAQRMYNEVNTCNSSFSACIRDWMAMYHRDIQTALVTFVLFVFRCAGAKGPQEIIGPNLRTPKKIEEYVASNNSIWNKTIPERGETVQYLKTRMNLEKIWTTMWKEAVKCGVAFDGCLFETVLKFLKVMSCSHYKIFSHTCAFLAMRLMPKMEATRIDLEVEMKEKSGNEETEDFDNHSIQLQLKMNKLSNLLKITLQIFDNSRRDEIQEIRGICLRALREILMKSPVVYRDKIRSLAQAMFDPDAELRQLALAIVHKLTGIIPLRGKMAAILTEFKPRLHSLRFEDGCKSAMPYILELLTFLNEQEPGESSTQDADFLFDIIVESKKYEKLEVERAKGLLVELYLSAGEDYNGFDDKEKVILNLAKYLLTNDSLNLGKWLQVFEDLGDVGFVYRLWVKVTSCQTCRQSAYTEKVLEIIITNFKVKNLKVYRRMPDAIKVLENGLRFCHNKATLMELLFLSAWYFAFPNIRASTPSEEYRQLLDILKTLVKKNESDFEIFKLCLHFIDRLFKAKFEPAGHFYDRLKKELKEEYVNTVHSIVKTGECLATNELIVNKIEMLLRYTWFEDDIILDATVAMLKRAQRNPEYMMGVIGLAQTIIWLTLSASLSRVLDVPDQDVAEGLKMKCMNFLRVCCEFIACDIVADKAFEHVCRVLKYFCKGLEKRHPSLAILAIYDDDTFIVPLNNYVKKLIKGGASFEKGALKAYWDLVQQGTIPVGKTDEVVNLVKLHKKKPRSPRTNAKKK